MRENYSPTLLFNPIKLTMPSHFAYSSTYGQNTMVTAIMIPYEGDLDQEIDVFIDKLLVEFINGLRPKNQKYSKSDIRGMIPIMSS